MIAVYKLLFDLSFYYTLAGFFLTAISGQTPFLPGYLGLFAALCLHAFLSSRRKLPQAASAALLSAPLLLLLLRPGIWPAIHMVPAWIYLLWSILSGRTHTEYSDMKSHLSTGVLLLFFPLFSLLLLQQNGKLAVVTVIPYLTVMLCSAVCLLRMLREEKENGLRQGLIIGGFAAFCILFTAENIPQLIGALLSFLMEYVVWPIFMVVVTAVGYALYGFFKFLIWIAGLLRADTEQETIELNLNSAAQDMGLDMEEYVERDNPILRIIGYIIIALLVAGLLFLLFRWLTGYEKQEKPQKLQREQRTRITPKKDPARSVLKPRDPRLLVRWYYAKFLRECRKREVALKPGYTTEEIAEQCSHAFPDTDPQVLRALYLPARYSETAPVTRADADSAADAWHALKHSKNPLDKVK